MNLIEIKEHMIKVRVATLGSLCDVFNAEPETMQCLLRHWECKGSIRHCKRTPACGVKCAKCPTLFTDIYEWVSRS